MSSVPLPLSNFSTTFQYESKDQEEWDPETTLYQPYDVVQILMPDMANCLAVQVFLKMLKLPFSVSYRANAENMSPTGKVPFIKCGQFVIAELEQIMEFVQSKGFSLTNELDKAQKSDMTSYISLVNTVFGNAETYIVWCDPDILPISKERCGSIYPFPLNYWVTYIKKRASLSRLSVAGWLNKNINEVYNEVDSCCKALSDRLGDSQYFFNNPTELDALVFGHVYTILTTALPNNQYAAIVRRYSNLTNHCTTIEKSYFNFSKNINVKKLFQ